MRRLLIVLALAACGRSVTAPVDTGSCVYVKQAVWVAAHNQLPVPDSLLASNVWNLPAPWYLGDETTYFTASPQGCLVVNR